MRHYRPNAGIVVFRSDGKVLLCQRVEDYPKNWQFPQGGIDEKETPLQAAYRELKEETSIVSVKFVASLDTPVRYDFPDEVKYKNARRGITNDGQEQYWHLFFFEGNDKEINLQTKEPEFKDFQWIEIEKTPDMAVEFKVESYKIMTNAFKQKIKDYLNKC